MYRFTSEDQEAIAFAEMELMGHVSADPDEQVSQNTGSTIIVVHDCLREQFGPEKAALYLGEAIGRVAAREVEMQGLGDHA